MALRLAYHSTPGWRVIKKMKKDSGIDPEPRGRWANPARGRHPLGRANVMPHIKASIIYVYIYICMYIVYIYMPIYVCICTYMCVYLYVCIYT